MWDAYSIDFSHTVEYGPDRLLVLTMQFAAGAAATMTFNGREMTKVASRCDSGADNLCAIMYYLVDPPVGTFNMHLGFSNGGKIMAGVMTLYGIDQANPLVSYGKSVGTGPTTSVTLAGQPGDLAMDILAAYCGNDAVPGAGQTERWDQLWSNYAWNRRGATSSELVSGSSVTMSYTFGSCDYGYVAAVFRDAAGATPTPTLTPSASPTATPPVPTPPSGQIWRSYYFAGSQRIAMRVAGDPVQANNGVFYLLADHLGSINVVVDEDAEMVGELRYKAWGETRYTSGAPNTDYRYTGQREEAGIGLYYYHARWYDPTLGRFAMPDSVLAGGRGPLAWDLFAYASDNPVRYSDPSGHVACEGPNGECTGYQGYLPSQNHGTLNMPRALVPSVIAGRSGPKTRGGIGGGEIGKPEGASATNMDGWNHQTFIEEALSLADWGLMTPEVQTWPIDFGIFSVRIFYQTGIVTNLSTTGLMFTNDPIRAGIVQISMSGEGATILPPTSEQKLGESMFGVDLSHLNPLQFGIRAETAARSGSFAALQEFGLRVEVRPLRAYILAVTVAAVPAAGHLEWLSDLNNVLERAY
jgi:RHS repeat-associated protein